MISKNFTKNSSSIYLSACCLKTTIIYLFHKAHLDLVHKIGPIIADVLVIDYWTE